MYSDFNKIFTEFQNLSNIEQNKFINDILDLINKNNEKKQVLNKLHFCPYCNSHRIVGNGKYKDRRRYVCKSCGKSFNDYSGTILSYIQDKDKFNLFAKNLLLGKSIRESANELNISPNTSFLWRKKILGSLDEINK